MVQPGMLHNCNEPRGRLGNCSGIPARVDITDSTIGFSTFHKFRNGEKVIYKTFGQTAVNGISTDAIYYVHTVGVSTVKLYKSETDAVNVGINTVILSEFGKLIFVALLTTNILGRN